MPSRLESAGGPVFVTPKHRKSFRRLHVNGGVDPRINGEQRVSEATRCRAGHQEVASRQAASRLLRCAPALRVTCRNLLIRLAFMAGSELPTITGPFARTCRSRMSTPISCVRQIPAVLRSHQHSTTFETPSRISVRRVGASKSSSSGTPCETCWISSNRSNTTTGRSGTWNMKTARACVRRSPNCASCSPNPEYIVVTTVNGGSEKRRGMAVYAPAALANWLVTTKIREVTHPARQAGFVGASPVPCANDAPSAGSSRTWPSLLLPRCAVPSGAAPFRGQVLVLLHSRCDVVP